MSFFIGGIYEILNEENRNKFNFGEEFYLFFFL